MCAISLLASIMTLPMRHTLNLGLEESFGWTTWQLNVSFSPTSALLAGSGGLAQCFSPFSLLNNGTARARLASKLRLLLFPLKLLESAAHFLLFFLYATHTAGTLDVKSRGEARLVIRSFGLVFLFLQHPFQAGLPRKR
jgi:hypothetical protein